MKLAIFDLDGVLADTAHIHTYCLRRAVRTIVSAEAADEPFLDAHDGVRTITKLKQLQKKYHLPDDTVLVIDAMKKTLTKAELLLLNHNKIAIEGIKRLREADFHIAVASNSRRTFVDIVLAAIGLTDLVDMVVCGNEVLRPKPAPDLFEAVMQYLEMKPSDTIVFEDSAIGMQAARNAGAQVIEVNPATLVTLEQITSII